MGGRRGGARRPSASAATTQVGTVTTECGLAQHAPVAPARDHRARRSALRVTQIIRHAAIASKPSAEAGAASSAAPHQRRQYARPPEQRSRPAGPIARASSATRRATEAPTTRRAAGRRRTGPRSSGAAESAQRRYKRRAGAAGGERLPGAGARRRGAAPRRRRAAARGRSAPARRCAAAGRSSEPRAPMSGPRRGLGRVGRRHPWNEQVSRRWRRPRPSARPMLLASGIGARRALRSLALGASA